MVLTLILEGALMGRCMLGDLLVPGVVGDDKSKQSHQNWED